MAVVLNPFSLMHGDIKQQREIINDHSCFVYYKTATGSKILEQYTFHKDQNRPREIWFDQDGNITDEVYVSSTLGFFIRYKYDSNGQCTLAYEHNVNHKITQNIINYINKKPHFRPIMYKPVL